VTLRVPTEAAHRKHKRIFAACCLMVILLSGAQVYRSFGLGKELKKIERNMEENLHASIMFTDPLGVTGDPYLPFHTDETPDVGIFFLNSGDKPVDEGFVGYGLDVVPFPLSPEQEQATWRNSHLHKTIAPTGAIPPRGQQGHYNTVTTEQPLSEQQAIGLEHGLLALCATARVVWTDKTGKYCTYHFKCFHREPGNWNPAVFNWHIQGWDYNREQRCDYGIREKTTK
jgi:hypothetical protein